jgi:hypothetical protein
MFTGMKEILIQATQRIWNCISAGKKEVLLLDFSKTNNEAVVLSVVY